jgi:hypothetical protein
LRKIFVAGAGTFYREADRMMVWLISRCKQSRYQNRKMISLFKVFKSMRYRQWKILLKMRKVRRRGARAVLDARDRRESDYAQPGRRASDSTPCNRRRSDRPPAALPAVSTHKPE